jgi:uncharacterized protein (DUF58 family)
LTRAERPAAAPAAGHRRRTGGAGSAAVARSASFPRLRPLGAAGARIRQWWLARHPVSDTWTLDQRNIYILPTRGGWAFGLTLVVMLLASVNYQLNLGYVLTFLLAGSGLVSIHQTHGTLRGLTLRLRPPAAVFAGEAALLEVVMSNTGGPRHGIGIRFQEQRNGHRGAWCDVPALGQASAHLSVVPGTRGWHAVPTVVVETRFPFGLFRAWTHWRPASAVLAYPKPEQPAPQLPAAQSAPGGTPQARRGQGGELDGVRAWRRSDGLRQVVWKKVARSGQLVSRDTVAESSRELWLDWPATLGADRTGDEARLSRLAAWAISAERQGLSYGLRLAGRQIDPDRGDAHLRGVLRELALWP